MYAIVIDDRRKSYAVIVMANACLTVFDFRISNDTPCKFWYLQHQVKYFTKYLVLAALLLSLSTVGISNLNKLTAKFASRPCKFFGVKPSFPSHNCQYIIFKHVSNNVDNICNLDLYTFCVERFPPTKFYYVKRAQMLYKFKC